MLNMLAVRERVCLLLMYSVAVVMAASQSIRPPITNPPEVFSCEPITNIMVCADIGYDNASFPNFRSHMFQADANDELLEFSPLIRIMCSNALVHLLCAVYAPFCETDHPEIRIKPCKELCEYVREGCEDEFIQIGLLWPPHLDCNLYPTIEEDSLCFGPRTEEELLSIGIPDPPMNVTAFANGARWVALRWQSSFGGNRPILSFVIQRVNLNETNSTYVLVTQEAVGDLMQNNGSFMYNVSNTFYIRPFTNYRFRVQACTELGCGEFEPSLDIMTVARERSKVCQKSPLHLHPSIYPPFYPNFMSSKYVRISLHGKEPVQLILEKSCLLPLPAPDAAPYYIVGHSPSSTSIAVTWDPPLPLFNNGILTGYRIEYTDEPSLPFDQWEETSSTDLQETLTGLVCYTEYNITVSAGTMVGYGPRGFIPYLIRTLNAISNPPLNIAITVGQTSLTLQWETPDMPHGIIEYYNVYYSSSKETAVWGFVPTDSMTRTPGNETTTTLNELFPNTIYTIEVSAVTRAGEGERSDEVTAETDPAAPPPPPIPIIPGPEDQLGGPRTITIAITKPSTINGPISHYHVVVVLLQSGTSLSDNGLTDPDTNYPTFRSITSNDQDPATCPNPNLGSPLVYIAAEFSDDLFPADGLYTVGDPTEPNDQTDDYRNNPLCYSSTYSFFLRAYPVTEDTSPFGKRQASGRQYEQFASSGYTRTSTTTSETTSALFQLRLKLTGDCGAWVVDKKEQKTMDIVSAVVELVETMCLCIFTEGNAINTEFSCRSAENTVVFRGEIVYTLDRFTAEDLVEFISEWVQDGALIVVDGIRLDVDSTCPAELESFSSEDCEETTGGSQETDTSLAAIVGSVLGGVCVLLLVILVIGAVCVVKRRRKHKAFVPRTDEVELSEYPTYL